MTATERSPETRRRIRMHDHLCHAGVFGDVETARYLLDRGAEVNNPFNPNAQTPLYHACVRGDHEMVALFREAGAKIGPQDAAVLGETEILRGFLDGGYSVGLTQSGWKSLATSAVLGGHLATVQLLAERGADFTVVRSGGRSLLLLAAKRGHREVASFLAQAGPAFGLSEAIAVGDLNGVRGLLDSGADPNTPIETLLPLTVATMTGQVSCARLLLERGADLLGSIHQEREDGSLMFAPTAAGEAIRYGWTEMLALLLEYGLPVNNPEKTDGSLLGRALSSPKIAALLLAHGAVPIAGEALGMALESSDPWETARLFPQALAALEAPNDRGWTWLMGAIWRGRLDRVRRLLELGANPHCVDARGATCLNLMEGWLWRHGVEIQTILLDIGLDVNTQDNEGMTPLMRAARFGHDDLVRLYLDHGADRALRNAQGDSAHDFAQNNPEILALLAA
ncbi:MAG: ankyrin repeat domain-containing protein [Capsulimonas sp.]|uniref:ankyrin repeat domain-containing protein n=1 Tax=Capsulimonas sp. TaxID=2494211 RepID=UPI00326618B3